MNEGQRMGVAKDSAGNVILNFAKETDLVSMPPTMAIDVAKSILRHAGVKAIEIDGRVTIFPTEKPKEG